MCRAIRIIKHILFFFLTLPACSQENCGLKNSAFKSGESICYQIHYDWGMIWVTAGEAVFRAKDTLIGKNTFYHFSGTGRTYEKYDWFYKVRDKYESIADTTTLKPLRFIRDSKEGGAYIHEDAIFNYKKKKIFSGVKKGKNPLKIDSLAMKGCILDVMTAIYYARCIDFSSYKPNDTIPITLVLDNATYPVHIRYIGKVVYHSPEFGTFNCIKFKPLLIEGTIFKAGEHMTVWVTDDKNKIPLYVETPIIVGTIKVRLIEYKNLRHPLVSRIGEPVRKK